MEHSFDINIAKKYGIQAAILFKHLYYWISKNKANEANFYDGEYWTYNSKAAFSELFPYLTARQIDYALQKLIDDGLVITGNYNKVPYDRTLWYAITKKGYSILQNCEMEATKLSNGNNEIVQPIPNINTDINTDINQNNIPGHQGDKCPASEIVYKGEFDVLWAEYPNKKGKDKALKAYIKARKAGTTCEEVATGIRNYKAEIARNKTAPEYIKHGATWFNQKAWEDEYNTKASAPVVGANGIKIDPNKTDLDDIF